MSNIKIQNAHVRADQMIQRCIIGLLRHDPFYASYLLRWPRTPVAQGSMGVDGRSLIYNPAWVEQQTERGLRFIMKHQVLHVALKHTLRERGYYAAEMLKDDRMDDEELRAMLNVAGDLEINDLLSQKDGADMPDHGLLPGRGEHAEHPRNKNMEVHFDILRGKRKPPEPEQPDMPDQEGDPSEGEGEQDEDCDPQDAPRNDDGEGEGEGQGEGDGEATGEAGGKGEGESGQPPQLTPDGTGGCGEFMPDPTAKTETEANAASQRYDQDLLGAVMASQQCGKCPGWAKELADAITAPAKIPWQAVLRRWARKVVRGGESSYSRPSRRTAHRTDIVLPSKRSQSIRRCLFLIDTSGSMSTEAVNSAVPEMLKIMATWKRAELVMVQCDTQVANEQTFKPGTGFRELQAFAKSPAWNGLGGTDLGPGFDLIPKYKPEVVVCLTDGYLSWPDQKDAHGLPVMFLMVNATHVPPWGQRLVMD